MVYNADLENREYGRSDLSCWPRGTLYPKKLTLTSATSGDRSVGIVLSRTKATELKLKLKSLMVNFVSQITPVNIHIRLPVKEPASCKKIDLIYLNFS
jgi:hypothetical protein